MFLNIISKCTIFEKIKLLNKKCVLWFYLQDLYEKFIIQKEYNEILS